MRWARLVMAALAVLLAHTKADMGHVQVMEAPEVTLNASSTANTSTPASPANTSTPAPTPPPIPILRDEDNDWKQCGGLDVVFDLRGDAANLSSCERQCQQDSKCVAYSLHPRSQPCAATFKDLWTGRPTNVSSPLMVNSNTYVYSAWSPKYWYACSSISVNRSGAIIPGSVKYNYARWLGYTRTTRPKVPTHADLANPRTPWRSYGGGVTDIQDLKLCDKGANDALEAPGSCTGCSAPLRSLPRAPGAKAFVKATPSPTKSPTNVPTMDPDFQKKLTGNLTGLPLKIQENRVLMQNPDVQRYSVTLHKIALDQQITLLHNSLQLATTQRYDIMNGCMRKSNQESATIVEEALSSFKRMAEQQQFAPTYKAVQEQIIIGVQNVLRLARASHVFDGFDDSGAAVTATESSRLIELPNLDTASTTGPIRRLLTEPAGGFRKVPVGKSMKWRDIFNHVRGLEGGLRMVTAEERMTLPADGSCWCATYVGNQCSGVDSVYKSSSYVKVYGGSNPPLINCPYAYVTSKPCPPPPAFVLETVDNTKDWKELYELAKAKGWRLPTTRELQYLLPFEGVQRLKWLPSHLNEDCSGEDWVISSSGTSNTDLFTGASLAAENASEPELALRNSFSQRGQVLFVTNKTCVFAGAPFKFREMAGYSRASDVKGWESFMKFAKTLNMRLPTIYEANQWMLDNPKLMGPGTKALYQFMPTYLNDDCTGPDYTSYYQRSFQYELHNEVRFGNLNFTRGAGTNRDNIPGGIYNYGKHVLQVSERTTRYMLLATTKCPGPTKSPETTLRRTGALSFKGTEKFAVDLSAKLGAYRRLPTASELKTYLGSQVPRGIVIGKAYWNEVMAYTNDNCTGEALYQTYKGTIRDYKATNTPPWESYSKTSMYRGYQSKTISGRTCQRWDSHKPHLPSKYTKSKEMVSNYCRSSSSSDIRSGYIWCYTTDPDKRFERCKPLAHNYARQATAWASASRGYPTQPNGGPFALFVNYPCPTGAPTTSAPSTSPTQEPTSPMVAILAAKAKTDAIAVKAQQLLKINTQQLLRTNALKKKNLLRAMARNALLQKRIVRTRAQVSNMDKSNQYFKAMCTSGKLNNVEIRQKISQIKLPAVVGAAAVQKAAITKAINSLIIKLSQVARMNEAHGMFELNALSDNVIALTKRIRNERKRDPLGTGNVPEEKPVAVGKGKAKAGGTLEQKLGGFGAPTKPGELNVLELH